MPRSPRTPYVNRQTIRDRQFHDCVAAALRGNRSFLDVARIRLRRLLSIGGLRQPYAQWLALLAGDTSEIARRLTTRSPEADRMRRVSPLPGVLTDAQQVQMFHAFSRRARLPAMSTYQHAEARVLTYIKGELAHRVAPPLRGDAQTEYLIFRFAHSTFQPCEVAQWLQYREPFLSFARPVDVLLNGQPMRVIQAIDAIDRAEWIGSGFRVPENVIE